MGTSNWQNISYCVSLIRDINPQKILDVGIGFGRWGILAREILDVWEGRIHSENWKVEIDGIEIYKDNIEDYHKYFYSNIYNTDAYEFLKTNERKYDLIILGDVLEHFDKERARILLNNCIENSKYVLLNIPLGHYWKQDSMYNNKYEAHLSFWKISDFSSKKIIISKKFRDEIFRKFGVFVFSNDETKLPRKHTFFSKLICLLNQYPGLKETIKKIIWYRRTNY